MRRTVRPIVLATLVASSYMFVAAAVTTGAEPRYSYVAVDYPSAVATSLSGINARGDIVGNYVDSNGMFHGFVLRDGAFATIDVPRAAWGYVIENGVFTRFRVPGSNLTAVWDVGPEGALVGVYRNSAGTHGFLLEDGEYTSIDYPAATLTRAFGINAAGDIVGTYVKDGLARGYLASRTGRSLR